MDDADFYAVQISVDGFGYDTWTIATFPTKAKADEYLRKYIAEDPENAVGMWGDKPRVVPQTGGEYVNAFPDY